MRAGGYLFWGVVVIGVGAAAFGFEPRPPDAEVAPASESAPQGVEERPAAEEERAAQVERDRQETELERDFAAAQVYLNSFKSRLRDPESARFRDMWLVRHSYQGATDGTIGAVAVCGAVNAPNAFGAYTGERMFIASLPIMMTSDQSGFAEPFQAICINGRKQMQMR